MMGNDSVLINELLGRLSQAFKIRDLGSPNFFLGIETLTSPDGVVLYQRRYMKDILARAGMSDCKALSTPASITQATSPDTEPCDNPTQYRRIVGALQYLTITRPNLSFSVTRLCQYMHSPIEHHWDLLKRMLHYVKGTQDLELRLSASSSTEIHAYSDSD